MRFEQVQRFILAKKIYFGVMGTLIVKWRHHANVLLVSRDTTLSRKDVIEKDCEEAFTARRQETSVKN